RIRLRQSRTSGKKGNQKYAETGGERGEDSHRSSSSEGIAILERAGVEAAIHQQVLPGDEARLGAAQEGAGVAELVDGAEAPRRVCLGAPAPQLLRRLPGLLRIELEVSAQPVGLERPGQEVVDRDIMA